MDAFKQHLNSLMGSGGNASNPNFAANFSSSKLNNIEEDAKTIDELVTAAKECNWERVWSIIGPPDKPVKAYLLNIIPENRRWGVLHQAVYWNNAEILKTLLKYSECDINMKAKHCISEVGETTRKTAVEIAQAYKYVEMETILTNHTNHTGFHDVETFRPWKAHIESKGLSLIQVSLAAYRKTFHTRPVNPYKPVFAVLSDIYKDIETTEGRWKVIRDKVCEAAYVVCEKTYHKLKECTTKTAFYEAVINTYTEEATHLYTFLNTALRRQREVIYRPTAEDLALGPYVVTFQMLLLFWDALDPERETTYRKMLLNEGDLVKYQVGTKFSWLSFSSSSVQLGSAQAFPTCGPKGENDIVFTINNTIKCAWQPRNIEKYAMYMEHERVYPAGARFVVTGKEISNGETRVKLDLLNI